MQRNLHCLMLLIVASIGVLSLSLPQASADSGDLGPAFHIGANPVYGPAPQSQINPAAAFGDTTYFVVWNDPRSVTSYEIYGTRVAAGGKVLDPAGIAITSSAPDQEDPAIGFDGTNYLVVWKDARNGTNYDIYGSRLSTGGTVLDPGGIAISVTPQGQSDVAIAFGDTTYLVVWADSRNGVANIYGARVTPGGAVLEPSGIAICADPGGQSRPAVTFNGSNWLVVWEDIRGGNPHIYGTRVATDGTVLDSLGIAVSSLTGDQVYPAAASNGTTSLVVWDDKQSSSSHDVYGARVASNGTVLDSTGIVISAATGDQGYPAATFDGTNYFIVWDDYRNVTSWDIYAARMDSSGTVLDPAGIPVSLYASQEFGPAVASSGGGFLMAWIDSRNVLKDIYGIRVASDGTVLDPQQIAISTSASNQSCPAMAFDGWDYLAVWHEWRLGTSNDIFGARVGTDGTVVDTLGIAISTGSKDEMYPAAAFGGTNYLVVWQDYRNNAYDIYGARVGADGSVLDPAGIGVSTATSPQEYPAVASDGVNFIVVWEDKRSGSYDIYAARVSPGGSVLDPVGIPISTATGDQVHPAIAFDGTNCMVVWQDLRGINYDIYGARIAPDGTVLDAAGIAISTASGAQEWPEIGFDGTNYFVVWQDKRGGPYSDIYGARVATSGSVVDPAGIAVSTAANEQSTPAVGFDGWKYLVAWQDKRSASTAPDIYGAKVDQSGTVLDPTGLVISKASLTQTAPSVCGDPSGQILIAYSSFTLPPMYGSYRIWANFYDSYAGTPGVAADLEQAHLYQNFPNPFVGSTTLRYYLPASQRASIRVYDVEGRLVGTILDGASDPGIHEVKWDAACVDKRHAAPGIYFLRMEAGSRSETRKVILLH